LSVSDLLLLVVNLIFELRHLRMLLLELLRGIFPARFLGAVRIPRGKRVHMSFYLVLMLEIMSRLRNKTLRVNMHLVLIVMLRGLAMGLRLSVVIEIIQIRWWREQGDPA
jgi:hypothetical protein